MGGEIKKEENSASKKHKLKVRTVAVKKSQAKKRPKSREGKAKVEKKEELKELTENDIRRLPGTRSVSQSNESRKRMIMYFGVSFFMVLIMIFWTYDLSQDIKNRRLSTNFSATNTDWQELTDTLSSQMKEFKSSLEEIKEFTSTSTDEYNDPKVLEDYDLASSSDGLVLRLKESLTNKASSTGTTSTENINN